ncbi:hypothetical protein B1A42_09215 [Serratia marcescens]|nr:hypothetical protein B1A42_09215 [Serratia marcescens]
MNNIQVELQKVLSACFFIDVFLAIVIISIIALMIALEVISLGFNINLTLVSAAITSSPEDTILLK